MKKISPTFCGNLKLFVLFPFFIARVSVLQLHAQTVCDSNACFSAFINDSSFGFREDWPFTANLIEQQNSLDGLRPARKVINIMLEGNSYALPGNNWFTEGIQFEIAYNGQKPDSNTPCSVELQYKGEVYSFIKGMSKLNITQFTWNADHRGFTLSYDYEYVMRCWAYATKGKPDIKLTGSVNHVSISIPGWLMANN